MKFNEKVFKLRKMKGLTQDEFAAAVGVSRQAVYKWESGQSYPEVPKLLEMKLLFGISLDDLLDESYEVVMPEKQKKKRAPKEKTEEASSVTEAKSAPVEEEKSLSLATAKRELAKSKEEVKEEPTEAPQEPVKEETVEDETLEEKAEPERKRGFFGRLFGRK